MNEHQPFEDIIGKIQRASDEAPEKKEDAVSFSEKWASPEEGAEQLYAFWRDYQRKRTELAKEYREKRAESKNEKESPADRARRIRATVAADTKLASLRGAIRSRFQDTNVRAMFERTLEREHVEEEKLAPSYAHYLREKKLKDESEERRLELYSDIFSHREKEPDELTILELTDLGACTKAAERSMGRMEREDPELSARLSFERLKTYREQLKKDGFIWTASREKYFNKIVDSFVKLNKNRPIFLYGETGTGKTQLARAVALRLTGRDPYEVGEEAKTDIRPLLGFREIEEGKTSEKGKTFVTYGQLGEAISGKHSSRDNEAGQGGIFYMDEMNGYPPDALRALIKQVSGKRHGDMVGFSAWFGNREAIAPKFGFIGSANLASEKHPDRPALTPEVARELRPAAIEVEYPSQTPDDPEMYEMMLAALMDQNDRIRVRKEELTPAWKEVVDARTNSKHWEIDTDPKAGGILWRFANFIAETQKSYQGKENILTPTERDASYLGGLSPLDVGVVIDWLQEYRRSDKRTQKLSAFLSKKMSEWGSHKLDSEEDRNLVKKFQEEFRLGEQRPGEVTETKNAILTPLEIGALSPRVPRRAEMLREAPKPIEARILNEHGDPIVYIPETVGEFSPETSITKKGDRAKAPFIFKGRTKDGNVVLETVDGEGVTIAPHELEATYQRSFVVYSERTNEGKDVTLDMEAVVRESAGFYAAHDLNDFLQKLPKEVRLSSASETRLRAALREGFDRAMLFPGADLQSARIEKLAVEMATKEITGLPADEQYADPYFESKTKAATTRHRPRQKAYLLLYQSGAIPDETKGKSPDQLDLIFTQKKWNGLTLSEWMMLQRKEAEATHDHRFDAYSSDDHQSQWTWLLDSRLPAGQAGGPDGVVRANWFPRDRQIRVRWSRPGVSDPGLGARPAVVVEVEV